jgi:hypothetical protein
MTARDNRGSSIRDDMNKTLAAYATTTRWLLLTPTVTARRRLHLDFYLRDPYLQSIGRTVEDVVAVAEVAGDGIEDLQFTIWTVVANEAASTGDEQLRNHMLVSSEGRVN